MIPEVDGGGQPHSWLGRRLPAKLEQVTAIRYVTPLREGGSLPAVMEADNLGTYVVKFRGPGQGAKALIAEVVSARLARACGLAAPDLVTVQLDGQLAGGEPDQEIQDLLRASAGLNLGVDFLSGAVDFDAAAATVSGELAGRIMWFDALVANADRSWRNPNLLFWRGELFLIDHGAALTFQHRWESAAASVSRPYNAADHALLSCGPLIADADAELTRRLDGDVLADAVAQVPAEWLEPDPAVGGTEEVRQAYARWLAERLASRADWVPPLRVAAAQPPVRRVAARSAPPAWLVSSPRRSASEGSGT